MNLTRFFRSLQLIYSSGLSLERGVDALASQAGPTELGVALQVAHRRLLTGWPLSRALAESGQFSALQIQLIRVGEETGSLEQVLEGLAASLERQQRLTGQLRSALIYPCFLAVLCGLLALLLPGFLFGPVLAFLAQTSSALPWSTRLVLHSADLIHHPVWLVLTTLLAAAVLRRLARVPAERWEPWLLRMPGLGPAWRALAASRFVTGLESVVRSGSLLLPGLQLAADASGSAVLASDVQRSLAKVQQEGWEVSRALDSLATLPPVVSRCVRVGLEVGSLEKMLGTVRRLLEEDCLAWVDRLVAAVEPLVLLCAGALVCLVVHATVGPMLVMLRGLSG